MINIFVLEDEILQQSRIETAILKILNEEQIKCRVFDVFGSSSQLLEAIEERGGHQLFFLDIEIKDEEKKGLEIAKEIRKKDPAATIVFVTTHSEFMPLTFKFKVSALDFIDKALGEQYFYERIKSAIDYTLASAGETLSQESFHLETSLSQIQVPLKKILYFETSPTVHKVILHTIDERIEFYATISEIEKKDSRLYRSHKSFVVNPANIERLDNVNKIIYFPNGDSCLVARTKLKGLSERITLL